MKNLSVLFTQKYNPTPDDYFLLFTRCAPNMAQTSWSINAGTAAQWLFSSALAPHTSATPAMMTSRGWPVSPRRNFPIVLQDPKASSWRVPNALCMWFTHQRGRSSPWAVGFAEMPTPSKQHKPFTENQFVYCDFQLLLKLSREAWFLHCQVSWTLNQVFALRQESSGLLFYQHQYPGSATNTSCGSFGFRVTWMGKNEQ